MKEINTSTITGFFILILILSIVKIMLFYSIGRSHSGKFQFYFPTLGEWCAIIIIILVLSFIQRYMIGRAIGSATDNIGNMLGEQTGFGF